MRNVLSGPIQKNINIIDHESTSTVRHLNVSKLHLNLKGDKFLRPWSTSKNENFKNDFFSWSEFYYWTKVKAKYVFLTKIMLLNEIQAFFVSFCFFALDNISFLFKFNLTSH